MFLCKEMQKVLYLFRMENGGVQRLNFGNANGSLRQPALHGENSMAEVSSRSSRSL